MNEIELQSFPFDSIVDDREYEAAVFRNYFGKFLTTGVYFGKYNNYGCYSMKVVTDTGLNIKVIKGCGLIKGADFNLNNDTTLSLEMPIGNNRNDMVVVRLDDTLEERKTKLYIKQGTSTEFAELERTIDVYEICLAKIVVKDRALEVTIDDITDTRRDNELCGIVTSLIDIDIQDVLDEINLKKDNFFKELNITAKEEADSLIEDLSNYCETVKHTLDGDVVINLMNLIDTTKTELSKLINDNTELINSNALRCKTTTLNQANWKENAEAETFEYTVEDITVTSNHLVQGHMDLKNQDKMSNGYIETFDGGYKIITSEKPEEDVTMNVSIQKGGDAL